MLPVENVCLYDNKTSKLNFAFNVLIYCLIALLISEIFFSIIYSGIYVVGDSMLDTLHGAKADYEKIGAPYYGDDGAVYQDYYTDTLGDYVYINKFTTPDYGNIVVIKRDDSTSIIKRVIAKGGDYVKIVRGQVYIRHSEDEPFGEPLDESEYINPDRNKPEYPYNTFYNDDVGYYIPAGYYFVLGDNRINSEDSRMDGNFSANQIEGVVSDWSRDGKNLYTKLHKFFSFDLPAFFGIDNRIKNTVIIG